MKRLFISILLGALFLSIGAPALRAQNTPPPPPGGGDDGGSSGGGGGGGGCLIGLLK